MRSTFRKEVQTFKAHANRFDAISHKIKLQCLKTISVMDLVLNADLMTYFETLLFTTAYPADPHQLLISEKELQRITRFLKSQRHNPSKLLINSGMPFTRTVTRFSHDAVRWLLEKSVCSVILHSFEETSLQLNEVLRLTLPSLEKSETTAGLNNIALLDALKVTEKRRLPFLIQELSRFDHLPYIKDHFYDRLEVIVQVSPKDKFFSKAYNFLPGIIPFFHTELVKRINPAEILDTLLPKPASLTEEQKREVVTIIKISMAVTARETDPSTFMEERSLRLYHLERGISIAIYGMISSRQLPLESYIGFTAFKNGFPVSYGGAWVFGERSNFGINIFETFRNGESAYIMAQLLRVYKHAFGINYFEVEPYQFGLDNPEGIESGAFWFYYRFGFRPLDNKLLILAKKEADKIKIKKGYRTSNIVLKKFTESSIGLKLGKATPPKTADIPSKVTLMIERQFQSNRLLAEDICRRSFIEKTGMKKKLSADEDQVLTEVALWAQALNISGPDQLHIMSEMIKVKPKDIDTYQDLVIRFFKMGKNLV